LQHHSLARLFGGASAIAVLFGAHAASAQAQRPTEVESVEVSTAPISGFVARHSLTASKTDTPLIELPRAVSVVSTDEMANRAVSDVGQIFQYSAGVNSDAYGGGPLSRVYSNVRGFFGYQYLDGLKMTDFNYGVEPYGLERAELLKGPPSGLFGQANPGGLLNFVSKRPVDKPLAEIQAQVGSYDRWQGAVDLGGPVAGSDKVLFRFTALARDSEREVRFAHDNRYFIAPAMTWRIGARTDLTLLASFQHDPRLTMFQFLPAAGTLTPTSFGTISRRLLTSEPSYDESSKKIAQAAYLFEHRFSDALTFRSNFRYTYFTIHQQALQGGGAVLANGRSVARTAVLADFDINIAQIDNALNARFRTGALEHNLLAGVDYAYIPNYQGQGTAAGPVLDLYAPVYNVSVTMPVIASKRQIHQRQTGAYVQDQVKLGGLSVLLGLRRDHATATTRNKSALTGVVASRVFQDDNAWSGQVGAIYALDNGLAPYVSYSTSFYPTAGADFFGKPFDPATGKQWEGGIKYQPRGLNLLVTAAVYDLRQRNVRTADTAHPGFAIQTAEIRTRGVEVEAKTSIAKLNLTAAYTHNTNRNTRSTTTNLGKDVPGRPRDQASLWADYDLGPVTLGGGVRYVAKSYGDALNTLVVPAYTVADALVRLNLEGLQPSLKGWDLSANASNLFDKAYVSNCDAATQCFYAPGRLVKATLRKRW
jgi:iron complex outermembrane receptor protein